mgnify:CR=1 FL=1
MALNGYELGVLMFPIGDVAADGSVDQVVLLTPRDRDIEIRRVRVVVSSDVSEDDTNYASFTLTDGSNTIASGDTTSGLTANEPAELTLSDSAKYVTGGSVLRFQVSQSGTGAALDNLVVAIEYSIVELP